MSVLDWSALCSTDPELRTRKPAYVFGKRVFLEQPVEYVGYQMGIGTWDIGGLFRVGPLEELEDP